MKTETIVWTVILIIAAAFLVFRASTSGMANVYVKEVQNDYVRVVDPETGSTDPGWMTAEEANSRFIPLPDESDTENRVRWTGEQKAKKVDFDLAAAAEAAGGDPNPYRISMFRTFGVWVAALFTLAIFSFLYRDNPLYKFAESVVVGVSAAYWMVVGFHEVIIPNMIGKLLPGLTQRLAMPGLEGEQDLVYLVPLAFGVMLLWRLAPKGAWISRWPLAFIIGTTAGFRMIGFIKADFLSQIRNSIKPLYDPVMNSAGAVDTAATIGASISNILLIIGVLACLVYFFFSIEHKGIVGKTAKLGIWFLMVTFGAAFGYTVMGRIALLAIRIEFLLDDWLWLIDPLKQRMVDT